MANIREMQPRIVEATGITAVLRHIYTQNRLKSLGKPPSEDEIKQIEIGVSGYAGEVIRTQLGIPKSDVQVGLDLTHGSNFIKPTIGEKSCGARIADPKEGQTMVVVSFETPSATFGQPGVRKNEDGGYSVNTIISSPKGEEIESHTYHFQPGTDE